MSGRAGPENVWLSFMTHRARCAWSILQGREPNIFPSRPPAHSVSTQYPRGPEPFHLIYQYIIAHEMSRVILGTNQEYASQPITWKHSKFYDRLIHEDGQFVSYLFLYAITVGGLSNRSIVFCALFVMYIANVCCAIMDY